ncbi:MAG: methyltransferase domain-containing protein [Alphaproteobacteria bacterium]
MAEPLPAGLWRRLRQRLRRARSGGAPGSHPWRTPGPVSRTFGFDRGTPIDRVYIARFLASHAGDIRGAVLEVGDATYTRRFGNGVTRSDVVHHADGAPAGAIVADLMDAPALASGAYQCVIATQTLQHIPDVAAAVGTIHRILAPGGVALITVPGIGQISRFDADRWGDFWRFTSQGLRRVLEASFPAAQVDVHAYGSAWTAVAALQGLAAEDLEPDEFAWRDADYEVVLTARVVK